MTNNLLQHLQPTSKQSGSQPQTTTKTTYTYTEHGRNGKKHEIATTGTPPSSIATQKTQH